jgi:rhomboid protease GluP
VKEGFRRAPLTRLLLVAIAAGFLAETLLGGSQEPRVLVLLGANVPELVLRGELWRLAASLFLHIGIVHLLVNGWALFQLGTLFELLLGSVRLAVVYFGSGIAGSVASVLFLGDPFGISAGASGAIFGLLGALIAFLLRRRERLLPPAKSLLLQLGGWAAFNVFLGFSLPSIDNAAHLGGCAVGFGLGWVLKPHWEHAAGGP